MAVFIVSLIIVIKTADLFVNNLVKIGEHLGISQIILGVTVSAIGTSLPEFGSAMIAVLTGSPDIGVGVVIGSNIWNIAGIIGISALISCFIETNRDEIIRDGSMTLLTVIILLFFMITIGEITKITGIVLIVVYIGYIWILIKAQKKYYIYKNPNKIARNPINHKNILFAVFGLIGLIVGCRILVYSGVELARIANIPEIIIGLFALAIGTSAAELTVAITSARKKMCSLSLGTVLGSNIFNILLGVGIPALIINIPVEQFSIIFDAPVLIFVTSLLLIFMKSNLEITRREGIILMGIYAIYAIIRIFILT